MGLTKPFPVRFSGNIDARLSAIAAKFGKKKADLIRIAVENMLTEIDQTGKLNYSITFSAPAVVAEEVRGSVTQIGTQNFSSDAPQRGGSVRYKKRAKK